MVGVSALLRRFAVASLAANAGIVVTGGVVRLTGSGLGCPTWPRCVDSSYVPTRALGYHGAIEFGNRMLTGVVGGLAVACVVLALLDHRLDRRRSAYPIGKRRITWAALVLAAIPAQAVVGYLVVKSGLNPWAVAGHFLLSMAVIAAGYQFWLATWEPDGPAHPLLRPPIRALVWLVLGVGAAVLAVGTVVTGSGPHAGDEHARRTGLDPGMVAQLHADLVMLLIGLSMALLLALRATGAPRRVVRAAAVLLAVELAQGAIGFTQYFTHLPVVLVGLHMAGACAVWIAVLAVAGAARERVPAAASAPARGPERAAAALA
jgi:heme a synthase